MMRELILFLNELSVAPVTLTPHAARVIVLDLINTLRFVRSIRPSTSLNSSIPFLEHFVDAEKTISQVLRGNEFREEWQFLRRFVDRSPFDADLPDPQAMAEVQYLYGESTANGLGWAHLHDTAGVSLASGDSWSTAEIKLCRRQLGDQGEVVEDEVAVRHMSGQAHVEHWREWIRDVGSDDVPTAGSLWRDREQLFPNLRFLERVIGDFQTLEANVMAYPQCINLLRSINRDVEAWSGDGVLQFSTKVSPEAEQRKKFCCVTDIDGIEYCFHLHGRFTGGIPGRVHLRVNGGERKVIIAYVGRKLDSSIV
jgi:hypothetical protein